MQKAVAEATKKKTISPTARREKRRLGGGLGRHQREVRF